MTVTRVFAGGFAGRECSPAATARSTASASASRRAGRQAAFRAGSSSSGERLIVPGAARARPRVRRLVGVLLVVFLLSASTSAIAPSASACVALRGLGFRRRRLGLRSLERRELLLGRKLATLGDDERLDLDVHVLEELDRDRVAADALDRVDRDLAPVDANLPRAPDLVGDVGRRDRAEERARRARPSPRTAAPSCRGAPRSPAACSALRASCLARSASTLRSSATRAGVAVSASRRGRR